MLQVSRNLWRRPGDLGLAVAAAFAVVLIWRSMAEPFAQQVPRSGDLAATGACNAGPARTAAVTPAQAAEFLNGMRLASGLKGTGKIPLVSPSDVTVGDFNGDGCADIGQVDRTVTNGHLQILTGFGDGTYGFYRDLPVDGTIVTMATFNADSDPFADIAIGVREPVNGLQIYSGRYLLGGAPGPTFVATPFAPTTIVSAPDLDLDRAIFNLGVAGRNAAGQFVFNGINTSSISMTDAVIAAISVTQVFDYVPTAMAIGNGTATSAADSGFDLFITGPNGLSQVDITTEVVWTSSPPTVATVSNALGTRTPLPLAGPGTANVTATIGSVVSTSDVIVSSAILESIDMNHDSVADIVAVNQESGTISTFLAQPAGGFQMPIVTQFGGPISAVGVMDFNQDEVPDFWWSRPVARRPPPECQRP